MRKKKNSLIIVLCGICLVVLFIFLRQEGAEKQIEKKDIHNTVTVQSDKENNRKEKQKKSSKETSLKKNVKPNAKDNPQNFEKKSNNEKNVKTEVDSEGNVILIYSDNEKKDVKTFEQSNKNNSTNGSKKDNNQIDNSQEENNDKLIRDGGIELPIVPAE